MKKLMIAAAIVCAAAMTQAASVAWKSGKITAPADAAGTKGTVVANPTQMYIFSISQTDYMMYAAMSYADASEAIWGALGGDKLPASPDATVKSAFGSTVTKTVDDASGMNYGAAIFTYTDNDGNDWYIANIGSVDVGASGTYNVTNLGTTFGGTAGGAIGAWTAVPEPTSGLLLLLGVAGLALKRKRA